MKNSPYLDQPFVPLAVVLRSMLAETETKIAVAPPAEKVRLQERSEVLREWVTHQDFMDRLGVWLAPLRSGEAQPLSVAGSHVLRGLLWYAGLTEDPRLGAIVLTLLDARWRQSETLTRPWSPSWAC
jgi:hypothetical protein